MPPFLLTIATVLLCEASIAFAIGQRGLPVFYAIIALIATFSLAARLKWWRVLVLAALGAPLAILADPVLGDLLNEDPFGMAHAITGPMNWVSFGVISGAKFGAVLLATLALSWLVLRALNTLKRRAA